MSGKRYFWLKLHDDFFNSKRIKKMRRMAGGDTYTIIYLKLQLMAMKKDGLLTYSGLEPTFAEELALDLDEQVDDVRMTLAYLVSCGLAESNGDASLFFPYAVENVGSEGASAARVRAFRERQNTEKLPDALHCNKSVTERRDREEIEIEKRREETDARAPAHEPFLTYAENENDPHLRAAFTTWLKAMDADGRPLDSREQGAILDKLRAEFPRDEWIAAITRSAEKKWRSVFRRTEDRKAAQQEKQRAAWSEMPSQEETDRLIRLTKQMEEGGADE